MWLLMFLIPKNILYTIVPAHSSYHLIPPIYSCALYWFCVVKAFCSILMYWAAIIPTFSITWGDTRGYEVIDVVDLIVVMFWVWCDSVGKNIHGFNSAHNFISFHTFSSSILLCQQLSHLVFGNSMQMSTLKIAYW